MAHRYELPQSKKKSFFLPLELFDSSVFESRYATLHPFVHM